MGSDRVSNQWSGLPSQDSCEFVSIRGYDWLKQAGLGPSQFEFEMRFCSVWLQRLPLFDQVIAIFKKELIRLR
jgi:hypothetical protein